MTKKQSAGLIPFRNVNNVLEVFLVHPGGPFWKNKDQGVWSIAKGEFDENEKAMDAAIREFEEETGVHLSGKFIELHPVTLKSGKTVYAWAIEKDVMAEKIVSNNFEMEWPPQSKKFQSFPEVDKAGWFTIEVAVKKLNAMQVPLLKELEEIATLI